MPCVRPFIACLLATVALAAGCGEVAAPIQPPPDEPDGGVVEPPLIPAPGTARDLTIAAGRVSDGTVVLDVELHAGVAPRRTASAEVVLEPSAANNPATGGF